MVPREQLVELPEDTYYDFDLIGCEVIARSTGESLGRVDRGPATTARRRCSSCSDGAREHLIPFVLSICVEIDVAAETDRGGSA